MKTVTGILAAGAVWLALVPSSAMAEPGKVTKLERKPLPGNGMIGFGYWGTSVQPLKELPEGVSGVEAVCANPSFTQRRVARHGLILTKSNGQQKHHDRLYLDANGDGEFAKSECHDISRSHGPITVRQDRWHVKIRPLEVRCQKDGASVPYWIAMELSSYSRGNVNLMYTSVTGLMGKVAFGDKAHLMAVYVRLPFDTVVDFSEGVAWPKEEASHERSYMTRGLPILLDADGNGTFDRFNVHGIAPESGRTTRLHRVDGAYWEVTVAPDGGSVRVTPAKPKVGTLAIPAGVESGSVLGPEFGACFTRKDKQIELPVGRYVLFRYQLRTPVAVLVARDYLAAARFEIRASKTTRVETGPPLTMKVTYDSVTEKGRRDRPPKEIRVSLNLLDRAGRSISAVWMEKGRRPEPPQLKILGPGGKTVLDESFKYG